MNEEVKKLIESVDTYNDSDDGVYYMRDGSGWLVDKEGFDRVVEELTKWNIVNKVGYPDIGRLVIFHRNIENDSYYVEVWTEETELYADMNEIDRWRYIY